MGTYYHVNVCDPHTLCRLLGVKSQVLRDDQNRLGSLPVIADTKNGQIEFRGNVDIRLIVDVDKIDDEDLRQIVKRIGKHLPSYNPPK